VTRPLPLALRNRLAARIVAAVAEPAARAELAALATDPGRWLGAEELEWRSALACRARRASEALADAPLAVADDLRAALAAAARLFDAGLFFEVHELLESHWTAARGETREALQGLIQIAVGWQHLANGNLAGARALLVDGAAKLHGRRLLDVPLDAFARQALEAIGRLPDVEPPPFPRAAL
jgi:predicted metal-dependent hydrolase